MEDIKAIVFDLGGVLVELKGVPKMLEWSQLPLNKQSLWQRWLHSPSVRAFETGQMSVNDFAEQIVAEMRLTVGPEQFLQAFSAWPTGLYAGVPVLLKQLRSDYTLACLSNTNTLHESRLLDEMQLGAYLDHLFFSHLIGKIKPDPESFEHVLDSLCLAPEQILFFDDNAINVDAAKVLGVRAVEVKGAVEVVRFLNSAGHSYSLNSSSH